MFQSFSFHIPSETKTSLKSLITVRFKLGIVLRTIVTDSLFSKHFTIIHCNIAHVLPERVPPM